MTTKASQDPSKVSPHIHDELDKVFDAEEVAQHSCDLCQRDLATDPEHPNAFLPQLTRGVRAVLWSCPSCIFWITFSN